MAPSTLDTAGRPPVHTDRWPMRIGLGLAAAGFVLVGVGGIVLAWDGGWFVLRTLETGSPTFLHGRVVAALVQLPAIVLGTLTRDAAVATIATGLAYAAVPMGSLWLTRRVTRPDRDDVLSMAVVAIGMLSLPGRAVLISEAMICVDLAWPLLATVALGRTRQHPVLVVVLVAAVMLLHPFGVVILAVAAGLAILRAVAVERRKGGTDPRVVAALIVAAGIAVIVALVRSAMFSSGYESSALDPDRLLAHARASLGPRPLVGVVAGLVLIGCVVAGGRLADRGAGRRARLARAGLTVVAALALLGALVAMLGWAADPARWQRALQFRTFVLPVHLPAFALLAVVALRTPMSHERHRRLPPLLAAGAGLVVIAVLSVQTASWRGVLGGTAEALSIRPPGCVALRDLPVRGTALDHWGTTSAMLLAEAPSPRHLVLPDGACKGPTGASDVPVKVVDGVVVDRLTSGGRALDLTGLAASLETPSSEKP